MHPIAQRALETAARNAAALLQARSVKPGEFGAAMEKGGLLSRKTVYNVLKVDKAASLETLAKMAEGLGVPLWALCLPDLHEHPELLSPGALNGIVQVVENYLRCTPARRADIEETARVGARLSPASK